MLASVRRSFQVAGAFFRLGLQQDLSYPLGFATQQLSSLLPVFLFYFVAKLVDRPGYFTFVVVGLIVTKIFEAGMRGFSLDMDIAINRGWLEMFLVEPLHWRMLPVSMVQWRIVQAVLNSAAMVGIAVLLGAEFDWSKWPLVLAILTLALAAGLAIGTVSASLKVLAKSGDPILFLYGLGVQLFAGVYFPLEVLPAPLRALSWVLPHTYAVLALRNSLMVEAPGWVDVTGSQAIWALVGFTALMFPFALWLYGRALELGRRLGVLGGY
jgi:ABC-2 type transport system permease protein